MNFIGEILVIGDRESHSREKFWNAGEQTDTRNFVLLSLRHQSLDQTPATTVALAPRIDGDGTNLRQMRTVKVKSAASDNLIVALKHNKVTHVLADFRQGPGQKSAVAGICPDQSVNLLGVWQNRLTHAHGFPRAAA
jgi:hypothetical protein